MPQQEWSETYCIIYRGTLLFQPRLISVQGSQRSRLVGRPNNKCMSNNLLFTATLLVGYLLSIHRILTLTKSSVMFTGHGYRNS